MKLTILFYPALFLVCLFSSLAVHAQTWQQVNSNSANEILDMYFSSSQVGFALTANGEVLKTTDGGNNWNVFVSNTGIENNVFDGFDAFIVCVGNEVHCYGKNATGENIKVSFSAELPVASTVVTGTSVSFPVYHNGQEYNLEMVNNMVNTFYPGTYIDRFGMYDNAIFCSDALCIYYSNDLGITWTKKQFTQSAFSSYPYQAFYTGGQKLIAITQYPTTIYISYDEGLNWQYHEMPSQYFYIIDPELALGISLIDGKKLHYSDNQGQSIGSYTLQAPVKNAYIYNENLAFVFGEDGVIYKSDNMQNALSVENRTVEDNFTVYPNPSNRTITLSYDADNIAVSTIAITDFQGKEVYTTPHTAATIIFPPLAAGIYFLQISTDKGLFTKKIIID